MDEICESCISTLKYSYAPYSKFRVSCVLESEDGKLFTGVNVENVSYGLTICAERTAICKAVSEGHQRFKRIVIACDDPNVKISPCGACRQVLHEVSCGCLAVLIQNSNHLFKYEMSSFLRNCWFTVYL